jgi:integrase
MPRKRANGQGGVFQYKNTDGSLKSAVWYGQYYNGDGKQIRKSTGEAVKQQAEAVLRTWMTDSARGLKPAPETAHVTYENLRDALLDSYRIKGHKSLQTLADGTETIYPLTVLDDFFKGKKASDIDSDSVKDFIRARQTDGVGNAAINNSLSLLRRMFSLARLEKRLQVTPHVELLKPPPARRGFLKPEDFTRLLAALPVHLRPLITFLYYCGVRIGEARQLQWSDVDLEKALIVLQEGQTKNDEQRIIPLPDVLVTALRTTPTTKRQGPAFDDTGLRSAWDTATTECKLDGLLVHDMRRSAVRNMMIAGAQQAVAMKISGHTTPSIFQRYNIVDTTQTVDVMRRVQQLVPEASKALPAPAATPRKRKVNRTHSESLVRVRKSKAAKY